MIVISLQRVTVIVALKAKGPQGSNPAVPPHPCNIFSSQVEESGKIASQLPSQGFEIVLKCSAMSVSTQLST